MTNSYIPRTFVLVKMVAWRSLNKNEPYNKTQIDCSWADTLQMNEHQSVVIFSSYIPDYWF